MIWQNVDKEKLEDREVNDFYATQPEDVYKALLKVENPNDIKSCLDLCSGKGVWGNVWSYYFNYKTELTGVELQNFYKPHSQFKKWYNNFDVLQYATKENLGSFDLIISNPPYKYAQEMIEISHDLLNDNGQIIMLLRLAFLESQKRNPFFKLYKPSNVYVMSNRPKFDRWIDGIKLSYTTTYPMAYAIYKWVKDFDGETKLDWIF